MLRSIRWLALLLTTVIVSGCGVSSSMTQLPALERQQPPTLLNAKERKAAIRQMALVAKNNEKQALTEIENSR